jgi:UDP-GlcNAc3NAcA epimerase
MKVISIVGTRDQFIKAARVSKALRNECNEILIHTGQHYDENLSQIFFDELRLPQPDICLGVGSGSHAEQTAHIMIGVERVIENEKPDWVIVYSDTNSTLGGTLAASKLQIPVAHVEAGLRSYNRSMPEEINRILCDHVASLLFCPTHQAVRNLAHEGISEGVYLVGDVGLDALQDYLKLAQKKSKIIEKLGLARGKYALTTIHRAGNTDDPRRLGEILHAFENIGLPVVFPVHPRTRKAMENLGTFPSTNLILIEPVGYLDMLWLEANADCILTDSGGIQKEAYSFGVRCITLREETEWVETVDAGWNRLVGTDIESIITVVSNWRPDGNRPEIYGDGNASHKIVNILKNFKPQLNVDVQW